MDTGLSFEEQQIQAKHFINKLGIPLRELDQKELEGEIKKLQQIAIKAGIEPQIPIEKIDPEQEEKKMDLITYHDFKKIDLRVARILSAEPVEKTDKLLRIQIDLGSEQRQIVAGIAEAYTPEELTGKLVAVVANLEPAVIRGVESNGMLLAASNEKDIVVLTLDKHIESGAMIK